MKILTYIFALALVLAPVFAFANTVTITGEFNGANCTKFEKTCPMNMSKGYMATEPDFVVTQPDGNYFYLTNVGRSVKANYLHDQVRVTGKMQDKRSIYAKTLEVKENGHYKEIWSLAQQKEQMREDQIH